MAPTAITVGDLLYRKTLRITKVTEYGELS